MLLSNILISAAISLYLLVMYIVSTLLLVVAVASILSRLLLVDDDFINVQSWIETGHCQDGVQQKLQIQHSDED